MQSAAVEPHQPVPGCAPGPEATADADRGAAWSRDLLALRDPQQRLSWVIQRARGAALPPDLRTPQFLVPGCAARLWVVPTLEHGRCRFRCDSDSAILKAFAALLCDFHDGHTPDEVIAREPAFLTTTGLLHQLTENRRRTIARVRATLVAWAETVRLTG